MSSKCRGAHNKQHTIIFTFHIHRFLLCSFSATRIDSEGNWCSIKKTVSVSVTIHTIIRNDDDDYYEKEKELEKFGAIKKQWKGEKENAEKVATIFVQRALLQFICEFMARLLFAQSFVAAYCICECALCECSRAHSEARDVKKRWIQVQFSIRMRLNFMRSRVSGMWEHKFNCKSLTRHLVFNCSSIFQ